MAPQYGPHRWSAGYHDDGTNEALRGATFLVKDLAGARFVDCDLTGVKVVDGCLVDVDLSGYVERLVVNGVDVTAYVAEELDRRHPERVQLRSIAQRRRLPGDVGHRRTALGGDDGPGRTAARRGPRRARRR